MKPEEGSLWGFDDALITPCRDQVRCTLAAYACPKPACEIERTFYRKVAAVCLSVCTRACVAKLSSRVLVSGGGRARCKVAMPYTRGCWMIVALGSNSKAAFLEPL